MVDACALKSGRNLVPQDQIERLLSLLLKAEERRWLASISPVNSSEHDDLQPAEENENPNWSFVDTGSLLLRHGKCIKRIHSKFHHLEPSHYCLKVTANSTNPDRPSSQLKVVSNDSNSSGQGRSSHSRTSTASVISQESEGNLRAKHPLFELYKNAVLCAQYPVLSVSQAVSPNMPYSPVSSPSSLPMQQRRFSFSKLPSSSSVPAGAKFKSNRRHTSDSSDNGCVSPEVSIPISSDALQELVRNVFELGRRPHKYYCESEIPNQVPRAKDPQRFLVEELLCQHLVLVRNHHPFYRVQAFMEKNAYDGWLIAEKEKIDCLIRGFWHYARPPVHELPLERPEFHKQYVDLMKRLIRHESKHKEPHPVHGGAIPSAPLSSPACRLLREFELRYGVGVLFCKISYLEYLVTYFENFELWYIKHIIDSLQDVMELVFICQEIFVADEFKMLLSILSSLLAKTEYSLTKIRRIFPVDKDPKDGVPALVELFELTLESARTLQTEFPSVFSTLPEARLFASKLATEPTCDLLASFLKDEMKNRYERIKVIASDELRQNSLSPQFLLKLILEIHHEVNYYNTSYKLAFSRYFDMMELAAFKFYSLLMSDVEQLCQNPPRTQRRDNVEPFMLRLAFRLSKLDKEWAKFIPYSHQRWRQPFQEFALQWLDAIGHSFRTLVPQLTSRDVWEAVQVNIGGSQERDHEMMPGRSIPPGPLGSKSAPRLSLTPSQYSAFNAVGPSNGTPAKSTATEGLVKVNRGKEPLHSRKFYLDSIPPVRARSPRTPGLPYDSSSEEETPRVRNAVTGRRAPKKSDHVQQVVAQIHFPRAQVDSDAKIKNVDHQPSSQGEPSEEESPASAEVDQEKQQSWKELEQGSSRLTKPATALDRNGTIEESIQSGNIDKGKAQSDQPDETLDNHENAKPGLSGYENDNDKESSSEKPQDDEQFSREVADDLEQSQHVSKADDPDGKTPKQPAVSDKPENGAEQLEQSCVVKPFENGKGPEGALSNESLEEAENITQPEMDRSELECSTEKNEVEQSGLTMTEESCVVQPLENGKHPESAKSSEVCQLDEAENITRPEMDQLEGSTEKNEVEWSGSTMPEKSSVVQPLENGKHPEGAKSSGVCQLDEAENITRPEMDLLEGRTEKNEVERSGSTMTEESCVVQPLENGKHPEVTPEAAKSSESLCQLDEAENKTRPEMDQLEGSTEKNELEHSGSTMTEESYVVQPLENGTHPEDATSGGSLCQLDEAENKTRPKMDQLEGSTEKNEVERSGASMTEESCGMQPLENGDSSVPTITHEPLEGIDGVHLENNTNSWGGQSSESLHNLEKTEAKVGEPAGSTEKLEGQGDASTSSLIASHLNKDADEVFHEGDSTSDCSLHSRASGSRNQSTPFENDTTGDSDSEDSIHTSDSFHFIEDDWKTKMNPAPKLGFRSMAQAIEPIEDGGISGKGHSGSDQNNSCQTCPARHSCCETEKDKGTQDIPKQEADDNKKSTISAGRKVAQQRPSAPMNIPAPRNRLLAKLRDNQSGSAGSKLSECGSFRTAVGSIHSGNSVESFHSARSSSSSLQPPRQTSKCDSDHDSGISHSGDDVPRVLPVSSSFVDVICAVNRLAAFACHLCKILCPDESPQRGEHAAAVCSTSGDDDLRIESLGIKRRLYHRLIQVMFSFLRLYSDNVLGMETCGLPDELLTEILGERVQRHLRTQRDARHLQGCRYNPSARECCNTRDSSGTLIPPCEGMARTAVTPGEFEPLTQQMGIRMSSVAILRSILPWLLDHVTIAIVNPDSMVSDQHRRRISSTEYELSLSYCENGPSLDDIPISSAAEGGRNDVPQPRADALHDQGVLNGYTEHFCRLEISQVKLLTYRINKFFKQVLRSLLDLNLPGFTIRKRLTPAMEFLSRELQRFCSVLYAETFNKFLNDLWTAVARNFEEESHRLVRRKSAALKQSKLLLQAVAYLMQFFHDGGDGLTYDTLAAPMDSTVQYLQLYTSPTDRLISMYHSLYKQVLIMQQQYRLDEFTSSVSISSHQASANAPADFVIQAMLKDLHATRKCFSGAALVEWMENYVRSNGYDNLGVCIGSTETETGVELGQYLLERGMLICVSPPPRLNQQTSTERRRQDQTHEEDEPLAERGRVFVNEDVQPEIRINNIATTRSNRSSPASSSRPASRSTGAASTGSGEEADCEDEDDDEDFLGSASDIWRRANSVESERDTKFENHPKAFYKFICEEDSSRTEVKISLGITDRLNLPAKLNHILCVLYTRRDSEKAARTFLRKLPRGLLDEAVGSERGVQCYPMRGVCQTL